MIEGGRLGRVVSKFVRFDAFEVEEKPLQTDRPFFLNPKKRGQGRGILRGLSLFAGGCQGDGFRLGATGAGCGSREGVEKKPKLRPLKRNFRKLFFP